MDLEFSAELWYWRGPSPFHFLTVPAAEADRIHDVARAVTYGWGMIPLDATIGRTTWTTAVWPKDDGYVLGVKAAVRRAEQIDLGDVVDVRLAIADD